jgi:lipoyl(octanoyl) transferase
LGFNANRRKPMHPPQLRNPVIHLQDWGFTDYADAWERQKQVLAESVAIKTENRALPLEAQHQTQNLLVFNTHNPVYTLGKSGKAGHLLLTEDELRARGIAYFPIERGGDITYHGPGQLTGYLIFDLENFFTDLGRFIRSIEEAVIRTLSDYGLEGGRIDGLSGVWLHIDTPFPRKICAIGIKCSRWVSMHGFAFNLNTDLSYFGHIVPCGINPEEKGVTSLAAELHTPVNEFEVRRKLWRHFLQVFEAQAGECPPDYN